MKRLLTILFLCLSVTAFGQFTKPQFYSKIDGLGNYNIALQRSFWDSLTVSVPFLIETGNTIFTGAGTRQVEWGTSGSKLQLFTVNSAGDIGFNADAALNFNADIMTFNSLLNGTSITSTGSIVLDAPTINLGVASNTVKFLDISGDVLTFAYSLSGDRVATFPDATGTIVYNDNTTAVTNKTLSGANNTFTDIPLSTAVTGDLPLSNLAQSSSASRLLGRGSASGAGDFQELTIGSGLSISGTVLSATTSGGTVTDVSIIKANGLNGSVATSTTTPAITLNTVAPGVLQAADPDGGSGTMAAPYTDADGTADIQTQVNALTPADGGNILLGSKYYGLTKPVNLDSGAIHIKGLVPGKLQNPNGEYKPTRGTTLYLDTGSKLLNYRYVNNKRMSTFISDLAMTSDIALQAPSVNGSTGVGTKAVSVGGYLEQSIFNNLKINRHDFGFYYDTAGFFTDVVKFENLLVLANRYGWYWGANSQSVYNQIADNVIADNTKHGLFVNANGLNTGWMVHNNTFVRNSGSSGILDNPANAYVGFDQSLFQGNIIKESGKDYIPLPSTQYTADGLVVSGDFNLINDNLFTNNEGGGSTTALRFASGAVGNFASGNLYRTNTANLIFDSGSQENVVTGSINTFAGFAWTDNGTRNIVNGYSKNAGDPGSAGVWNGQNKPAGINIFDATSGNTLYHYPLGSTINNVFRQRWTSGAMFIQHTGTGASDVSQIGVNNSTHSGLFYTTTSANTTFGAATIIQTGAANGLIISTNNNIHNLTSDANGTIGRRFSTSNTNAIQLSERSTAISTGAMSDGFGGSWVNYLRDNSNVDNPVARYAWTRDGADNSAKVAISTFNAGTEATHFNIASGGNVAIGNGTTSAGAQLQVTGNGTTTGQALLIEDSGGTDRLEVLDNGTVTITGNVTATNLTSGTYTPTLTNTTNVAASTAYVTGYYRIGNSVTVYGKIDIDATLAASAATELQIALPIATNMTGEEDLGGTAISDAIASLTARVKGDATTDRASVVFKAISLTNDSYSFEFSYQVK